MFWKLRGAIREKNITQNQLATYLGISNSTLSLKLNGKSQFTLEEAKKISEILSKDVREIFF
ncbi:MAG: helix-turn-helix transcriptional regulator [Clostridium sp.]